MKSYLNSLGLAAIGLALSIAATPARAVDVTIDSGATWLGYMNVFETSSNGGGYVFGSSWGVADLTASFSGSNLTLGAAKLDDPAAFWYVGGNGGPGSTGNKTMEASSYVQSDGPLSGVNLTFSGTVLSNTLVSGYSVVAFIMDFAPDYSSNIKQSVPVTSGDFSVTLATTNDPARHVQYGFIVTGLNVWSSDVASKGSLVVGPTAAVPEPSSFAAIGGLMALGVVGLRRRRA
jgi:hypothetical protein